MYPSKVLARFDENLRTLNGLNLGNALSSETQQNDARIYMSGLFRRSTVA